MGNKLNYILGGVTITVIIGGTIYAIKKAKDLEKLEEEAITVEEAREEVKARRNEGVEPKVIKKAQIKREEVAREPISHEEMEEIIDEARDAGSWNSSFNVTQDENNEEDKSLKHDPNSVEARNQFINMELAEWHPMEETYQLLKNLFDFPFRPETDGDDILLSQIIDYRIGFFGPSSRWATDISMADIILHYARLTSFNVGDTIKYWVNYILEFNEFYEVQTSVEIEGLVNELVSHTYYNKEKNTHSLFGLTGYQLEDAVTVAESRVDGKLTFEIEYNEFLKSCL